MKALSVACHETKLLPSEGQGYALAVELTSTGDEPVPVSGVYLCRQGINAFPEFAEGFGFDTSKLISGLPPEQYQFRVQMLVAYQGQLLYGDGKSEFQLAPGRKVKFVMPVPFQTIDYFLNSPAEDLFIAVANLNDEDRIVEVGVLHDELKKTFEEHAHLGRPYNVNVSIIVPQSAPISEDLQAKVGTTNSKAIKPMPNN